MRYVLELLTWHDVHPSWDQGGPGAASVVTRLGLEAHIASVQ